MNTPVYLDNHSTTRMDPRVVESMMPYFSEVYGNASSKHHEFGWKAAAAVEWARGVLATLLGSMPKEILFTSGATESINLALKGAAAAAPEGKSHIVTVATEHSAVLDVVAALGRAGFSSTVLPVDRLGRVDPSDVRRAVGEKTLLVSVMLANNEIGTLQSVREIAALCRARGILVCTDATQAVGHMPVNVQDLGVDLLSCSAHKMYGPKGVGALFVRGGLAGGLVKVQMHGGGQESGLRSGTLNVPGIMGFGAAARFASEELAEEAPRVRTLRDALARFILDRVPDSVMNGDPAGRLDRNLSVTFRGARADAVMMSMKRVAVSSGSACSAVAGRTSHVLRAIGLDEQDAASTLRFGLGRFTTAEEISFAGECVAAAVSAVRAGTAVAAVRA